MKSIQISNDLYCRYEKLGMPLIDTHETLMGKLISLGEIHSHSLQKQSNVGRLRSSPMLKFSFSEPPNMTHTQILRATLNGKEILDKNWNGVIRELLCFLDRQKADILNQTSMNVKNGKDCSKGYKYISEIGISYQGLSAEDAFRAIKEFSEKYKLDISINFIWRDKPNAQYPGNEALITTDQS